MVKTFHVYIASGIKGYNPPDYYRTLNSADDATAFENEFRNSDVYGSGSNYSIDNNIGKVVCTINDLKLERCNFILLKVTQQGGNLYPKYYCGVVDNVRVISERQVEVTYTVDWFTSYALTYWLMYASQPTYNDNPSLIADTVLYRRLTAGEFDYKDEAMVPRNVNITRSEVYYTFDNGVTQDNLFTNGTRTLGGDRIGVLLVYHESTTNTTHWIVMTVTSLDVNTSFMHPSYIWSQYCFLAGVGSATYPFNGDNVLYYGLMPIAPRCLLHNIGEKGSSTSFGPCHMGDADSYFYVLNRVHVIENRFDVTVPIHYGVSSCKIKAYTNLGDCSDYNVLRLLNADGSLLYELPRGCNIDSYSENFYINFIIGGPDNCPYILCKLYGKFTENNQLSFSIPFIDLTYYSDAYSIYLAQERQYAIEMRNLESINELASGIIGGINQGAMISAFSRSAGVAGLSKGLIGGGMAGISALLMAGYEGIYANKEATSIEDRYNRNKSDTLAMTSKYPVQTTPASLYAYRYDTVTITNIQAYQQRFGYQTQKVENNVNLKAFEGYVQADVIFSVETRTVNGREVTLGLNSTVERYIKQMFSYGVWFTHIALTP